MKRRRLRKRYTHNYRTALCGKIGAPEAAARALLDEGWRPRSEHAPLSLAGPIDWRSDPHDDRNWRFLLHAWRMLDPFIVAHNRSGDRAWLHHAVRVMLDWGEAEAAHGADDAELFWNDMGSGLRAGKLAYVLNRLDAPDEAVDAARLRAMADRHIERLVDPDFFGLSNHGFFQVHGLMSLAMLEPSSPRGEAARTRAVGMLRQLMRLQFGREGVHLEHSPGYHQFALNIVTRILSSRWYGDLDDIQALVAHAREALPWFVFPDGRMSAMGDSERRPVRSPPAQGGQEADGAQARLFAEAGYAVVRSAVEAPPEEAFMLLVAGGHHSQVHKHADDLSFELYDRGRFWIVDTGKYSYSRLDWRQFTDSARAHNSIDLLQERENNGVKTAEPAGGMLGALHRDGDEWVIQGALTRPAFGVSHERTLRYRPGAGLTIIDRVRCDRPRQVTAWLHLAPDLKARRVLGGWRFPGGRIRYSAPGWRLNLVRARGRRSPVLQGWAAEGYHEIVPADALGVVLKGQDIALTTEIRLDPFRSPSGMP